MQIKKWLEQFPSTQELAKLYQSLREKYQSLDNFPFPQELIEFLYSCGPEKFKTRNEILHLIISECRSMENSAVLAMYLFILLYPFFKIPFHYWRKRFAGYQFEEDEIWNEIFSAFRLTLDEFDLEEHRDKIGLFFQSKAGHHLYKVYIKKKRQKYLESRYRDDKESTPVTPVREEEDFTDEDLFEIECILEKLVEKKIIDKIEKNLIFETKILKKPIKQAAKELSLSYWAAIKKRRRAEYEVWKAIKKKKKRNKSMK